MTVRIINADVMDGLAQIPDDSVHCCATSPPYWGLRLYNAGDTEIGLEPTLAEHIDKLVAVFAEVRRVLRPDGVCFLNYGDVYNAYNGGAGPSSSLSQTQSRERPELPSGYGLRDKTLKPKDNCLIPERLAIALQSDGWWVRDRIVWHKPNPMPSSVKDRCTPSYELVYMLTRSARYWWDGEAIREPVTGNAHARRKDGERRPAKGTEQNDNRTGTWKETYVPDERNARNVWTITTEAFPAAHFATFPTELVRRMLLAGCPEGGTVLDPFGGSGTVGLVADRLKRDAILIDLSPDYCAMARQRIEREAGLFASVEII